MRTGLRSLTVADIRPGADHKLKIWSRLPDAICDLPITNRFYSTTGRSKALLDSSNRGAKQCDRPSTIERRVECLSEIHRGRAMSSTWLSICYFRLIGFL